MAEISCKHCGSRDCRGCNIYRLEQMLDAGKLDPLMNENRAIQISADVAPVVRCKNCLNWKRDAYGGVCDRYGIRLDKDWFCAGGEKREVQHDN